MQEIVPWNNCCSIPSAVDHCLWLYMTDKKSIVSRAGKGLKLNTRIVSKFQSITSVPNIMLCISYGLVNKLLLYNYLSSLITVPMVAIATIILKRALVLIHYGCSFLHKILHHKHPKNKCILCESNTWQDWGQKQHYKSNIYKVKKSFVWIWTKIIFLHLYSRAKKIKCKLRWVRSYY